MNDFPEAPAVAYTAIRTPNGFEWSYTLRAETGVDLNTKITKFEEFSKANNWEPLSLNRGGFKKKEEKYVEGRKCPKCGGRLVERHKKEGALYYKCENSKWDAINKKAMGCEYVDWLNDKPQTVEEFEKNNNYEGKW